MKHLGLLLSAVVLAISAYALNDWGDIVEIKETHPDYFRPGAVLKVEHLGEDWYVYCGEAEKCFKDETDSELYEEAVVQAKMYLFGYFSKDDPRVKVEVVGARRLYQFQDGNFRCVVMGVLAKDVKIISGEKRLQDNDATKGQDSIYDASYKEEMAPANRIAQPMSTNLQKGMPPKQEKCGDKGAIEVDGSKKTSVEDKISEYEKLDLLRARLEANPKDYHTRIRMGRIFAAQGKVKRALNNYNDAARLMIFDDCAPDGDKVDDLFEIAKYEDANFEYSRALKHYRALLRMRDKDKAKYANARISALLLKCDVF